jgi:RimJ/RimL family protein N-acetyltransferase
MNAREEALECLRRIPDTVRPDQTYVVEPFRPTDGEGVAELFYRTYGDTYPMDRYYIPDAIRQSWSSGKVLPVVARLPDGKVVGFASLYRSSPPFTGLMELGLGMVHPAYRGTFILFHLLNSLNALMEDLPGLEAVFGEAVCDTIITQHASTLFGFRECALELDLMPGTGAGRVACLVMFHNLRDVRRRLFVPACYAREIEAIVARLELDRELSPARGTTEAESSLLNTETFAFAGLLRGHLFKAGEDCRERFAREEQAALDAGCRRFQWFLNLADPGVGIAVGLLRDRGYGLAGLVPRWFNDDALLMYKLLDPPAIQGILLYSDTAREMLRMVLAGQDVSLS